jgi:hypothetical protein
VVRLNSPSLLYSSRRIIRPDSGGRKGRGFSGNVESPSGHACEVVELGEEVGFRLALIST